MIIDTHCHLDDERYNEDIEQVLKNAKQEGVEKFIIPGADPKTLQRAVELSEQYEGVYFAVGVHPYDAEFYDKSYLENVEACQLALTEKVAYQSIFRPPYGKASRAQLKQLQYTHEIVMWDVLSGDFDQSLSPEDCLKNTIKATQNGSIVIFHDNIKAKNNLIYALPRYIEHCQEQGFEFKTL